MDLAEKKQKVEEITAEQRLLLKKSLRLGKLPVPKRPSTLMRRIWRLIDIGITVNKLQTQKAIIIGIVKPKDPVPIASK